MSTQAMLITHSLTVFISQTLI